MTMPNYTMATNRGKPGPGVDSTTASTITYTFAAAPFQTLCCLYDTEPMIFNAPRPANLLSSQQWEQLIQTLARGAFLQSRVVRLVSLITLILLALPLRWVSHDAAAMGLGVALLGHFILADAVEGKVKTHLAQRAIEQDVAPAFREQGVALTVATATPGMFWARGIIIITKIAYQPATGMTETTATADDNANGDKLNPMDVEKGTLA